MKFPLLLKLLTILTIASYYSYAFAETTTTTTTTTELPDMTMPTTTKVQGTMSQSSDSTASEDASITSSLQSKIAQDPALVGSSITVSTNGGVVYLNGVVSTQAQADGAINAAKSIPGVKDVKSTLNIRGQGVI